MSDFGPPTAVDQTSEGQTWFAVRDYGHRQEGFKEGTSAFISYQSFNEAGTLGDWVLLNGGLIDRTPGKEQGDLDIIVTVDGQIGGVAVVGNMTAAGGPPAAFEPMRDRQMNLGNDTQRWKTIFAEGFAIETVGKQININGVWQWISCVPIRTQEGVMYMPVFRANE
jgi:hypothetical protein